MSCLIVAIALIVGANTMTSAGQSDANWARDPRIAVQEEYDLAIARGTAEALELFIARHPESQQAAAAAARLRSMKRSAPTAGEPR